MAFDKFTNSTTSIRCFEDAKENDGIGEATLVALKAKVLSAVVRGWSCDCTLVATSLLTANTDEIKELWKFLRAIEDLEGVSHEGNSTKLQHCSGKTVTRFFVFGGKLVSDQIFVCDNLVDLTDNSFDSLISDKKESKTHDRNSMHSADGLDFGECVDVTGQGMTQSTDYHFTPQKLFKAIKTTKTKKEVPMPTRRSNRVKKN
jgi:hypothetical protein